MLFSLYGFVWILLYNPCCSVYMDLYGLRSNLREPWLLKLYINCKPTVGDGTIGILFCLLEKNRNK